MTGTHLERERKFDGGIGADLPALDGLAGVAEVSTAATEDLDAVYYDTADLRLLAHRVTLRRRTGGHDAGWHLKLPAGPDARLELQLPLSAGRPGRVPRALALRVRVYTRGQALAPVVRLHTERRRTLLLDRKQRTLAEVARDAVSAQRLPGPAPHPDPAPEPRPPAVAPGRAAGAGRSTWTEVEAELVKGDEALLDAVEQRLLQAGLRRSAESSKLARALGPARPPTAGVAAAATRSGPPPGSVGAAVTSLLRGLAGQLLALDPAVRTDEPDAVHRMRITTRRLRSALKTHAGLFRSGSGAASGRPGGGGGAEAVAALGEELRWLGGVLGEARDQEVLAELLTAGAEQLGPQECPGPVRERLADWARSRSRSTRTAVAAALDSDRYFALLDALEQLAAQPPLRTGAAARRAGPALERRLLHERRRVARRLKDALRTPAGPQRDTALHEARKAAKRARYAGEGAEAALGRPARRFARRMRSAQELLGARQDALLACRELPVLAAAAHAAGEQEFGYGVLYAGQRAVVRRCDGELPAVLEAVRSSARHAGLAG